MAQVKQNSLLILGAGDDSGKDRNKHDKLGLKQKDRPRSGGASRPSSGGAKGFSLKREDSNNSLEILPPEGEETKRKTSARKQESSQRRSKSSKEEGNSCRPTSSSISRPGSSRNNKPESRPSSSSKRAPPAVAQPDSSSSWRTPTPTKQIPLQAVRRKQNVDQSFGEIDWDQPVKFTVARSSHTSCQKVPTSENTYKADFDKLSLQSPSTSTVSSSCTETADSYTESCDTYTENTNSADSGLASTASSSTVVRPKETSNVPMTSRSPHQAWPDPNDAGQSTDRKVKDAQAAISNTSNNSSKEEPKPKIVDIEESDEFDTDLSDAEEGEDEEEEEKVKAPNELFMEFLTCMMEEDYENAKKLCKMILIYEPENAEALKFQNLIEEKMLLDEEETESEDTDSEDDDDDEDDSDDDSASDEDDSEEDGENDDDDADNDEATNQTDSGVVSANEDS